MLAGAGGGIVAVFVSFNALEGPVPQGEVNASLILSPAPAALLLVYLILMTEPVNKPESNTPVVPIGPNGIVHE
jgi:hypothetical protein